MKDIFKLGASAAGTDFCDWDSFATDVYVSHRKCQTNHQSTEWSSAACASAIVNRNHLFRSYLLNYLRRLGQEILAIDTNLDKDRHCSY